MVEVEIRPKVGVPPLSVSVTWQTEAEAQALLSQAKQAVDAVIERTPARPRT